MARLPILDPEIKALFGANSGRCGFPDCDVPAFTFRPDGRPITRLEIAHICAAEPGGARFDADATDEDNRKFANLLLLCGTHHGLVDSDETTFSKEALVGYKIASESSPSDTHLPDDLLESVRSHTNSSEISVTDSPHAVVVVGHRNVIHNHGSDLGPVVAEHARQLGELQASLAQVTRWAMPPRLCRSHWTGLLFWNAL